MTLPLQPIRALLLLLGTSAAAAQITDPAIPPTPARSAKPHLPHSSQPAVNLNVVVLDPAHGGADNGATLSKNLFEKDVTVALAGRIRTLLKASGFTVVTTHESASDTLTDDQRVELSNRSHPLACLLLHASNDGHGVHLFTSSLTLPAQSSAENSVASPRSDPKSTDLLSFPPILPWDDLQAGPLRQSLRLTSDLATALKGIRVPLVLGHASVRPIDSLTCPAVALEIAPLASAADANSNPPTPVSDAAYQQRVAQAVAEALVFWRGHAVAAAAAASAPPTHAPPAPAKTAVKLKPKPAPSDPKSPAPPSPNPNPGRPR